MKTKQELLEFENISTLFQYLYLSDEHKIIYNNGMTDLELRMEGLDIIAKNLKYNTDLDFNSMMSPSYLLALIDLLKETKSSEDYFENKWDEIEKTTKSNLGLNRNSK